MENSGGGGSSLFAPTPGTLKVNAGRDRCAAQRTDAIRLFSSPQTLGGDT